MMRKFILGIIAGVILAAPGAAIALDGLPWANAIYYVQQHNNEHQVSVFDDQDNKCYVVTSPEYRVETAISCLKK